MNELLNRITSYNLFNYLFPGAVFSVLADQLELLSYPDEIITMLVWFYFVGMAISRIGSVVLEPVLRRIKFVRYADYRQYLRAAELDSKLNLMVEASNMYRTIATALTVLIVGKTVDWLADLQNVPSAWRDWAFLSTIFVLFLFSFRKQSDYVRKRVEHHHKDAA